MAGFILSRCIAKEQKHTNTVRPDFPVLFFFQDITEESLVGAPRAVAVAELSKQLLRIWLQDVAGGPVFDQTHALWGKDGVLRT